MLRAANTAQKLDDFLRAQNYGQFLWLLRRWDNVLEGPVLFERDFIEKSQGGNGYEDGARGQLLFVGQVNLVGSDVLGPQLFRRFIEVTREQGHWSIRAGLPTGSCGRCNGGYLPLLAFCNARAPATSVGTK